MSKAAAPAPATPSPSPAPAADSGPRASAPPVPNAAPETLVTYWDNESQSTRTEPMPRAAAKPEPDAEEPAAPDAPADAPGKEKTPAEAPGEQEGEEPAAAKPKAERQPATERRRAALEALSGERRRVELETTLKATQDRLKDLESKTVDPREWARKTPLKEVLAARGMTQADLEDMLIRGSKDLEGIPTKAEPQPDPALAELRAQVAALTKQLETRQTKEAEAEVQQAVNYVASLVKDQDIPVTHAVGGYELVMRLAHELWLASGKSGAAKDYTQEAGELAEEHFRKERPGLAALADRAKGTATKDAREDGVVTPPQARSIGRRTGTRPDTKTDSLWSRDSNGAAPNREEIDARIKREMGFVDKY